MEKSSLTSAQQILATAEKPETPLHEQRGLLENISRMQHDLTPDELWPYMQMSSAVRARLARHTSTNLGHSNNLYESESHVDHKRTTRQTSDGNEEGP